MLGFTEVSHVKKLLNVTDEKPNYGKQAVNREATLLNSAVSALRSSSTSTRDMCLMSKPSRSSANKVLPETPTCIPHQPPTPSRSTLHTQLKRHQRIHNAHNIHNKMNAFPEPSELQIEFAKQLNRPKTVQFKHLAVIMYIFGGTSALIYIVSKTILSPLFQELTFARSEYAQHARRLMEELNAKLSTMASYIPPVRALQGEKYADAQTQTDEDGTENTVNHVTSSMSVSFDDSTPLQRALAEKEKHANMVNDSIANLERLQDSLKHAGEVSDLTSLSGFKYQVEELTNYSDQLAMSGYSMMKSGLPGHETAMSETKKEIRSLKGSVLSVR